MDWAREQRRASSGLVGAALLFAALVCVTRIFSFAELSFWPIVLVLFGVFVLIVARPQLEFPIMSRSAWLKALAIFGVLWTSFAIKWDTELSVRSTVRGIVAEASVDSNKAYARWKSADMESRYRFRQRAPDLSEAFYEREDREERAAAAAERVRQQAAEKARRAEEKRREEAWKKNPLRYPVEAIALILVLLSLHGNPGH